MSTRMQAASVPSEGWFVKGPMGIGLNLDPNALHVAFLGGTGILVVLDIVARLAIKLSAPKEWVQEDPFGPKFKFILYYTFASEEDALGLELCKMV